MVCQLAPAPAGVATIDFKAFCRQPFGAKGLELTDRSRGSEMESARRCLESWKKLRGEV